MKKKQTKEKTINRVLLGLIVFLLAVIVISSIFYLRSSRPAVQAKKEAVEIARNMQILRKPIIFIGLLERRHTFH